MKKITLAMTKPPINGITTELSFKVLIETVGSELLVAVLSLD